MITSTVSLKQSSDELMKAGDYCVVENLGSSNANVKTHRAVVMKCPYCSRDIATVHTQVVKVPRSKLLMRLSSYFNFPHGVTVVGMIQCPYGPSHKFSITKGRLKAL